MQVYIMRLKMDDQVNDWPRQFRLKFDRNMMKSLLMNVFVLFSYAIPFGCVMPPPCRRYKSWQKSVSLPSKILGAISVPKEGTIRL